MAVAGAAAAAFGGYVLWTARQAADRASKEVASQGEIQFAANVYDRALPQGFESLRSPAVFRDAVIYRDRLHIAGPAGLSVYDAEGQLEARYRPGFELPASALTSLAVGSAGDSSADDLWIGTAGEGLLRFDGRVFHQIRAADPRYRKAGALLPVSTGRILMGGEKSGVLVWDGKRLAIFHESLKNVPVTVLAGDDTDLWVGTSDRGLLHWRAGRLDSFAKELPDLHVLSIAVSGESVYAGTAMGVAEFKSGVFTRLVARGYFAQSLLARGDKLLIGTLDEGTIEAPLSARPGRFARVGQSDGSIQRIFEAGGQIYALSENNLLRDGRPMLQEEESLLADRDIAAISVDSSGRTWIGYFDRGLEILPASGGRGLRFEDDHLFCVNRIVHHPSGGQTAVATANGLVLIESSLGRRRVIGRAEGLIANHVTDVAARNEGWVAATPSGVSFIDSKGISSLYAFHGLVNNHVYALGVAGPRTMAGTLGGLSILDGQAVSASFTTANSALGHNWVSAIVKVEEEWFAGTYGAGVVRMDAAGRWHSFPDLRAPLEINPNAMLATASAVYAGTLGSGLAVYRKEEGRWRFVTTGLPSQNVTAIAARGGFIHIGTDNGMVRAPESAVLR